MAAFNALCLVLQELLHRPRWSLSFHAASPLRPPLVPWRRAQAAAACRDGAASQLDRSRATELVAADKQRSEELENNAAAAAGAAASAGRNGSARAKVTGSQRIVKQGPVDVADASSPDSGCNSNSGDSAPSSGKDAANGSSSGNVGNGNGSSNSGSSSSTPQRRIRLGAADGGRAGAHGAHDQGPQAAAGGDICPLRALRRPGADPR